MELVSSKDGTRIAYRQSGHGPPLLLVHGATSDHTTTWPKVLSALEDHFTVCAMDRRGRGSSGDSPNYELAREAEDIIAVIDALGQPVNVLGHSFGGLCAIEAALLTSAMRKLVLYEGVPLRGADLYPPGLIERMHAMMQSGDTEGALVALLQDLVGMPPEELELLRSQTSAWQRRLANTSTVPRELATERQYVFDPDRFKSMITPTLLLVGGESPPRELNNARGVVAGLPNGRIAVLSGQQHAAMHSAPDLFVQEVVGFFME